MGGRRGRAQQKFLKLGGAALIAISAWASSPTSASAFVWPNVPDRIARSLQSSDPNERRAAAQEIATLPSEVAKPLALRALNDEDDEVRITAAKVVAKLRIDGAGDLVAGWLTDSDSRVRLAACEVIRAAPTDRSIQALGRVLADPSKDVRVAAAQAMGRSTSSEAVSLLLGHLDDGSPEVRAEVASALGRLGDQRAVLPLVGKVQDAAPEVRRRVARSLGELKDARAAAALVLSLTDQSVDVRVEAALALGRIGSDEATTSLAPLVQGQASATKSGPSGESSLAVRQAALRALGQIGSQRAIELLVAALDTDRAEAMRTPARDALVTVGKPAVKPLLAALSSSPSARVASGAVSVLGALGDVSAAPAIVRAMQRGTVPAPAALSALSALKADDALPSILELIDDPSGDVRRAAIRAATAIIDPAAQDGRAVDVVRDILFDPTLDVDDRIGLIELLGRTGSPRAADLVVSFVGAKAPALRRASLRALGSFHKGSPEIDEKLVAALDDDLATVRMDAAVALSRVGTPALARKLMDRLLKSAEQDRGALGIALAGVLSRATDGSLAVEIGTAVTSAPSTARDALLEGLGRMQVAGAVEQLRARASQSVDDRRKVAEVAMGQGTAAEALLVDLARDLDPGVRANAAWSLGFVASKDGITALAKLAEDGDVNVAGNALASLGRTAARAKDSAVVEGPACKALADTRAYVRANALSGLFLAGGTCDVTTIANLLATDTSERVRIAAAALLRDVIGRPTAPAPDASSSTSAGQPTQPPPAVDPIDLSKRVLDRCAAEDPTYRVARACEENPQRISSTETFSLTIFVVPDGSSTPVGGAPFALALPDGTLRLGLTDRRGVVYEAQAPVGEVELAVPAALANR
ncbi:MAG: HEAT repeat domain-containing protein [Polyangiaceae bacterium]